MASFIDFVVGEGVDVGEAFVVGELDVGEAFVVGFDVVCFGELVGNGGGDGVVDCVVVGVPVARLPRSVLPNPRLCRLLYKTQKYKILIL